MTPDLWRRLHRNHFSEGVFFYGLKIMEELKGLPENPLQHPVVKEWSEAQQQQIASRLDMITAAQTPHEVYLVFENPFLSADQIEKLTKEQIIGQLERFIQRAESRRAEVESEGRVFGKAGGGGLNIMLESLILSKAALDKIRQLD